MTDLSNLDHLHFSGRNTGSNIIQDALDNLRVSPVDDVEITRFEQCIYEHGLHLERIVAGRKKSPVDEKLVRVGHERQDGNHLFAARAPIGFEGGDPGANLHLVASCDRPL